MAALEPSKAGGGDNKEARNQEVILLDHQFRSLTSLGEMLYNEQVHKAIHGSPRSAPSPSREEGVKLVRYISRLLVRGLGENVAFALKLAGRTVKYTAASSNTLDTHDLAANLESSNAYPNSDPLDPNRTANQKTSASYSDEAIVSCSFSDVLAYVIKHCRHDRKRIAKAQTEKIIRFDVHVKNTLLLLRKCSEKVDDKDLMDAKQAFYCYTGCMGIERWGARYRVSGTFSSHFNSCIPFDKFLQRPDPFHGICDTQNRWPKINLDCTGHKQKKLVENFLSFATIFTEERQYEESEDAKQHWENRQKIALPCYEKALDAIKNSRFDSYVAWFYHVALGQTLKDVDDMSQKAFRELNSKKADYNPSIGKSLFGYETASLHLYRGIGTLDILLKTYEDGLAICLLRSGDDKSGPNIRREDWSSTPSTRHIRQDSLSHDEEEDNDDRDDNWDDDDDESISSPSQSWITGYIEWLENSVKGIRSAHYLSYFAQRHPSIIKAVDEHILIVPGDRPSSKMQQWQSTIKELYNDATDDASRQTRDDILETLHCLAAKHQKNESHLVQTTKDNQPLSFRSLNTGWHESFRGTRHGESQFAIEYVKEVITFA